jgi:NADPH2:quinone reductase
MKALLSKAPGGPETLVLDDIEEPAPGSGAVRVQVHAVGVNFPDSLIIQDLYQVRPVRPFAPGAELAGVIDAVGEGVADVKVGDRVMGWTGYGAMAEKLVLPASRCIAIPDAMPFDDAAALLMTYGTSQHALKDRGKVQPDETLLVLGAGGGVGLAAVELGKAYGARVVAAASSADKAELARAAGADAVMVYPKGPFDGEGRKALSAQFKAAVGGDGAHVIYDPVGGDYAEAALRAIGWEGRYLVVGFPAGIPKMPLNLTLLKSCQIVGVFWGAFVARSPAQHLANVQDLLALYAQGAIKPAISQRYALTDGGQAIAALAQRRAQGKLVVMLEG